MKKVNNLFSQTFKDVLKNYVPAVEDGSKYHSVNDDDKVHNPIVGLTTPKKLKELELKGVVIFRGAWRIPTILAIRNGKSCRVISPAFLEWERKRSGKRRDFEDDESRMQSLVSGVQEHMPVETVRYNPGN